MDDIKIFWLNFNNLLLTHRMHKLKVKQIVIRKTTMLILSSPLINISIIWFITAKHNQHFFRCIKSGPNQHFAEAVHSNLTICRNVRTFTIASLWLIHSAISVPQKVESSLGYIIKRIIITLKVDTLPSMWQSIYYWICRFVRKEPVDSSYNLDI